MAPWTRRCNGLGQCAWPANLDNLVHASPSGQGFGCLSPVRRVLVIDHMICAQFFHALKLFIRG